MGSANGTAEARIPKPEDITVETSSLEKQRGQRQKNRAEYAPHVTGVPEGEGGGTGKKRDLRQ